MLSAAQLAAFQATSQASGDESIQVQRMTPTSDGMGGHSEAWANVGSAVLGNLAQPSGNLMQNYGYLIGPLDTWMVRVPVGTNVLANDRLVTNSKTLRVQVILQPQSYQTSMRLLASAIPTSGVD
jgi:hypothetical protein